MLNKGLFTSNTDLRSTPQDLFDKLDNEFHFTVDVCANDQNHKCDRYYTIREDGLSQNRDFENVFCNPPYGRSISDWVKKGFDSFGGVVVMLLPARTDTKWFHDYIYNNNLCDIRFLKGRLKFGGSKNSAPFPSMIVIFWGILK